MSFLSLLLITVMMLFTYPISIEIPAVQTQSAPITTQFVGEKIHPKYILVNTSAHQLIHFADIIEITDPDGYTAYIGIFYETLPASNNVTISTDFTPDKVGNFSISNIVLSDIYQSPTILADPMDENFTVSPNL
jgi:hypothetical protein